MGPRCIQLRPGRTPCQQAWQLQRRIAEDVRAGADATLILLEHPPTYTLGARAKPEHLLLSADEFFARGVDVLSTDRGGDVTFHGPGQLVGYPIVDLRRTGMGPSAYVRTLEATLIDVLARFGIAGTRSERNAGVWVGGAKIAAIGVRVSRGVTTHGFALNVNTDLGYFQHIIPCGLAGVEVTSMQHVAGRPFQMRDVEDAVVVAFCHRFGLATDNFSTASDGVSAVALAAAAIA